MTRIHAAMVHTAVLIFGLECLSYCWPWLAAWWTDKRGAVIAVGAFMESLGAVSLCYTGFRMKPKTVLRPDLEEPT